MEAAKAVLEAKTNPHDADYAITQGECQQVSTLIKRIKKQKVL